MCWILNVPLRVIHLVNEIGCHVAWRHTGIDQAQVGFEPVLVWAICLIYDLYFECLADLQRFSPLRRLLQRSQDLLFRLFGGPAVGRGCGRARRRVPLNDHRRISGWSGTRLGLAAVYAEARERVAENGVYHGRGRLLHNRLIWALFGGLRKRRRVEQAVRTCIERPPGEEAARRTRGRRGQRDTRASFKYLGGQSVMVFHCRCKFSIQTVRPTLQSSMAPPYFASTMQASARRLCGETYDAFRVS